jgi:hypothetical protein
MYMGVVNGVRFFLYSLIISLSIIDFMISLFEENRKADNIILNSTMEVHFFLFFNE